MSRHIFRLLFAFIAYAISAASVDLSTAQAVGYETLSPNEAARIGMVGSWQQQMNIPGGGAGIVDARVFVDESRKQKIVEVVSGGKTLLRLAEDQLNSFGQPLGSAEAMRIAQLEVYKLKRRGIEATISQLETPHVRLYVLAKDGTIEARNAETGQILWNQRFGNPRLPSLPMTLSAKYLAFVNGAQILLIDAFDGTLINTFDCKAVPLQGPIIVGDYIMAVCTGRQVTGFSLSDFKKEPFTARVAGLPMARPVSAPLSPRMMWPTSSGFVYAIDGEGRPGLVFRFPADGIVSSQLAFGAGNHFFAATDKGQIYGLSANGSGKIQWRFSLGDPIYDSPHLVGEKIYFKTVYGDLHCLDAKTGAPLWQNPMRQVDKFLGGIESQILVRTVAGTIRAIDSASGTTLVDFSSTGSVTAINNPMTNRIYLVTSSGTIQCLRPVDSELPKLILANLEPSTGTAPQTPTTPSGEKPETTPFGFEGDAATGTETLESDPFGGTSGSGESDPFGGSDDPFGG